MRQQRCAWCGSDPLYIDYHDNIWGRPVADSLQLFEKLCLDGQQAGLSWLTILKKQQTYQQAYQGFVPEILARWGDKEIAQLLSNPGIVRNKLKIKSIINNARAYLKLTEAGQSFSHYLWHYVDGRPKINSFAAMSDVPAATELSRQLSKDLKKVGFNFVGETIVYAFMQAVGMVNDHIISCPQHLLCCRLGEQFSLR